MLPAAVGTNRVLMPSPPGRLQLQEATSHSACILISIIPPFINSKSTCFAPGENNPRLVSPASPGAVEGLNPPDSATSFSLGAVDSEAVQLAMEKALASEGGSRGNDGRMGWASY